MRTKVSCPAASLSSKSLSFSSYRIPQKSVKYKDNKVLNAVYLMKEKERFFFEITKTD